VNQDPPETLLGRHMSVMQVVIVAITVGLNALDGFDVLSISFASPGIAREWGINRAALGIVLSMELLGMSIGSIALGTLADRLGRRHTLIASLLLMTLGMGLAAGAGGIGPLCAWRVLTGIGIGGVLATTNALATEFSSERRRDLAVSMMAIGYPMGAVIGGLIVAQLLKHHTWHAIFVWGAIATAAFIPAVLLWVPESVAWLSHRQPAGALERLNRSLTRIGHGTVKALPPRAIQVARHSLLELFAPNLALRTLLVTLSYFLHITTFYFILKWVPKIVVDMGFTPSSAAGVLVWANIGGVTGGAVLGLLTQRWTLRYLTAGFLILSTLMVSVFGHGQNTLAGLSLICALTGFCTNGGVVGLYAVLARAFPASLRAGGTGLVIGIGRGGAMLAPIIAGYLFQNGFGLQYVAIAMSSGSLVAALCLIMLRLDQRGVTPA